MVMTFNQIKEYANYYNIIVEKVGKRYESYRNDNHSTIAEAINLEQLNMDVQSFIDCNDRVIK
jgi:hypothetical protein